MLEGLGRPDPFEDPDQVEPLVGPHLQRDVLAPQQHIRQGAERAVLPCNQRHPLHLFERLREGCFLSLDELGRYVQSDDFGQRLQRAVGARSMYLFG